MQEQLEMKPDLQAVFSKEISRIHARTYWKEAEVNYG
jgi:hypothetical protein